MGGVDRLQAYLESLGKMTGEELVEEYLALRYPVIRTAKLAEELAATSAKLAALSKVARDEDLLTSKEIAEQGVLGVTHHKTVEAWTRKRGLPCVRLGRNLRFRRGDVLRWRAQQEA